MKFVFVFLGMTSLIVFLYKREWLLNKKKAFLLLGWNSLLFISSFLFSYLELGDPKYVVAMKMSLIAQLMFLLMAFLFKKLIGRTPKDTFWGSDASLMADGIFNFIFWVAAIVLPAILVFTKVI